jgi:hypothetical protein
MPGPGRRFEKGQVANPHGRAGKPLAYDEPEFPEPVLAAWDRPPSEMLRDLRWAYRNFGRRCVGTPHQMAYRRMLEADRSGFTVLLSQQEKLHAARVGKALSRVSAEQVESAAGVERDEGSERARRIYDAWLADPRNWEVPEVIALREENEKLRRLLEASSKAGL